MFFNLYSFYRLTNTDTLHEHKQSTTQSKQQLPHPHALPFSFLLFFLMSCLEFFFFCQLFFKICFFFFYFNPFSFFSSCKPFFWSFFPSFKNSFLFFWLFSIPFLSIYFLLCHFSLLLNPFFLAFFLSSYAQQLVFSFRFLFPSLHIHLFNCSFPCQQSHPHFLSDHFCPIFLHPCPQRFSQDPSLLHKSFCKRKEMIRNAQQWGQC